MAPLGPPAPISVRSLHLLERQRLPPPQQLVEVAATLGLLTPDVDDLLNQDLGWVLAPKVQMVMSMRRRSVPIVLRFAVFSRFIREKPRSQMEVSTAKQQTMATRSSTL